MSDPVATRRVYRRRGGRVDQIEDAVVVEEPVEIRIGGVPIAVIMRTPGDDLDLVLGFALTEGIALDPAEVAEVLDLGEGRFEVRFVEGTEVDPEQFRRNLYATSSCGVCGKASIDAVRIAARTAEPGPLIAADVIDSLPEQLATAQPSFDLTGGMHAAAAFDASGAMNAAREDVGRHNAVDKLVGTLAHRSWPVASPLLLVSGRVSFEIVQKAAVAGFRIVAGISAVSSLGAELAAELGLTTLGFVRSGGFNVYSGEERIGNLG